MKRKRFFRFSLRTILIVMTVLCVWLGWHKTAADRQAETVRQIQNFGGRVTYDFMSYDPVTNLVSESKWPKWILDILGQDFFHSVTSVELYVNSLELESREDSFLMNDESLKAIAALSRLEVLNVPGGIFSDQGVQHLTRLRHLKRLNISQRFYRWRYDVAGVESRVAEVRRTEDDSQFITDRTMDSLDQLKHLDQLSVSYTGISDARAREFMQDHPKCTLVHTYAPRKTECGLVGQSENQDD